MLKGPNTEAEGTSIFNLTSIVFGSNFHLVYDFTPKEILLCFYFINFLLHFSLFVFVKNIKFTLCE